MRNYKISVRCKDGHRVNFKMQSNRVISNRRNLDNFYSPLVCEAIEEAHRRGDDPKSKVHQHGGPHKLVSIENVDTGNIQLFSETSYI